MYLNTWKMRVVSTQELVDSYTSIKIEGTSSLLQGEYMMNATDGFEIPMTIPRG